MNIMDFGRRSFVTHTTGLIERIKAKENQMRKFRAWDIHKKQWIDPNIIAIDGNGLIHILSMNHPLAKYIPSDLAKFIIIQFSTGLKDKNDNGTNEAYEDDIVIISCKSDSKLRFKGVIKYSAPEFYVACFWEDIDGEQCSFPVGENNRSLTRGVWSIDEIIGNIHQHPELMEQKNGTDTRTNS